MGGGKVKAEGRKANGVEEWQRNSNVIVPTGKLENRGTREREGRSWKRREGGRQGYFGRCDKRSTSSWGRRIFPAPF